MLKSCTRPSSKLLAPLTLIGLLTAQAAVAAPPRYRVEASTDGFLYGAFGDFRVTEMNESGKVAGWIQRGMPFPNGMTKFGWVWDKGNFTDLGNLGAQFKTQANGINDAGQIVGSSKNFGFIWENGTMSKFNQQYQYYRPNDINNNGQAVGKGFNPAPFLYDNGAFTDLALPQGYVEASAYQITDSGKILGIMLSDYQPNNPNFYDEMYHAVIWENDTITDLGPYKYDPENGNGYRPRINNSGQVIGAESFYSLEEHFYVDRSFLWDNGVKTYLPSVRAVDINDRGQIIANDMLPQWNEDYTALEFSPSFWENGQSYDLENYIIGGNVNLDTVYDINNRGQIFAQAGSTYVLLSPVPEPASMLLLSGGLLGMGVIKRRKS